MGRLVMVSMERTIVMEMINRVKRAESFLLGSNAQHAKVFGIAPKNVKPLTGGFIIESAQRLSRP